MAVSHSAASVVPSAVRGAAGRTSHWLAQRLVALHVVMTAAIVVVSVAIAGGLSYTLDDPYIHLAVAENLLRGGYGINLAEYSSPSSTILYPLLLAGTEALGFGPAGPLVVAVAAAALGVYLGGMLIDNHLFRNGEGGAFKVALGVVGIFAMSAVALPMTGMEHSLHVLAVVAVLYGLAVLADDDDARWWLWLAIVALPLLRFEGLALALAAVAATWLLGRRLPAAACLGLIVLELGVYAAVMLRLGLPVLPSSVMVKSPLAAAAVEHPGLGGLAGVLALNAFDSVFERQGAVLLLLLSCLALGASLAWETRDRRAAMTLAGVTGFTIAAHVAAGEYNWFYRYEVYAVAAAFFSTLLVWRLPIRDLCANRRTVAQVAVIGALAVAVAPYAYATRLTPAASRAIAEQQFQMHRFVTEFYRKPVGANDIGWVSYRNDAYVLDLWGLASEETRRLRAGGRFAPRDLADVVARHRIELVMIYESWFEGQVPDDWRRIATLNTRQVSAASGTVSFFTVPGADAEAITAALRAFKATLPARASLTIAD